LFSKAKSFPFYSSAYHLEPEDFNEISKLASTNEEIRRKINLQSYYYK
jgi:hypothetical protein